MHQVYDRVTKEVLFESNESIDCLDYILDLCEKPEDISERLIIRTI